MCLIKKVHLTILKVTKCHSHSIPIHNHLWDVHEGLQVVRFVTLYAHYLAISFKMIFDMPECSIFKKSVIK